VVSFSTSTFAHPFAGGKQLASNSSRPVAQFFKRIFSAIRSRSSTTEAPVSTTATHQNSAPYASHVETHAIANFTDFSTYLLGHLASENTAIKFSYIDPNTTELRAGNYSVITFIVPHEKSAAGDKSTSTDTKNGLSNFLNFFRNPWNRGNAPPPDTVYSQFPAVIELFAQRIQAYFSIYKYTDESRLNNTIVIEMPENYQQEDDDIIETTTDYQMETSEMEEISTLSNETEEWESEPTTIVSQQNTER
jgi:hypothetical protein